MESLPIVTVRVDFHFIKSNGNNFQCSDSGASYYAPAICQQIIAGANAILSDPAQSNQTSAPKLPDSRIRFALYDDETPCNAIFIHDEIPTSFSLGDALHILIKDDGFDCVGRGSGPGPDKLFLFNIHCHAFDHAITDFTHRGGLLCHEFGHVIGLTHTFESSNSCPEINPEDECGAVDPDPCIWNHSNNVMSYGNQTALVTSQWAQMYGSLFIEQPQYVVGECSTPVTSNPLEISNGVEVWTGARYVDTDIEIRPGATLIVQCILAMAKDKYIIVNRGGRLFVNGATIYGESPTCRWGGILVHGKSNVAQPDVEDAKNEYHTLTSSDAGVVWLKDAALHWANTGIATKGSGTLSTHDYFGGLVMVDNGRFVDCGRAVEFMKYNFKNKSYLDICTIELTENQQGLQGQGISVWACSDISFGNVQFIGLKQFGVTGINYSASIESCEFIGTTVGDAIRSENTMPSVTSRSITVNACSFRNNRIDVVAYSTPNFINEFLITDNVFDEPAGTSTIIKTGVHLRGESFYDIRDDNEFIDKFAAVRLQSTGGRVNRVRCNWFGNHGYASVSGK